MFKIKNQLFNCDLMTFIGLAAIVYCLAIADFRDFYIMLLLSSVAISQSLYWHIRHYKLTRKLY